VRGGCSEKVNKKRKRERERRKLFAIIIYHKLYVHVYMHVPHRSNTIFKHVKCNDITTFEGKSRAQGEKMDLQINPLVFSDSVVLVMF
jgi:hypothetical protein